MQDEGIDSKGPLADFPSVCPRCRCHQLLVNYTKIPFHEFDEKMRDTVSWDVGDTRLLINSEGCGYPPRVNCTEFAKEFG